MSLQKSNLENAIKAAFLAEQNKTDNPTESINRIAKGIADAVDLFVKSGTVTVTVSTVGTAAAQTGTGTGTII